MQSITRRTAASFLTAAAAVRLSAAEGQGKWTSDWDRALLDAAVARGDRSFDSKENMIRSRIGPEYHYHTNLRSTDAHPTRDSLMYALYLYEVGRNDRAAAILDRLLALQDADPASKWYGVWSYYMEEPLAKMDAVDFNWADFNGSALLLIEFRHGSKIEPKLRARLREGIGRAAASVRKRNVTMSYTNIAIQGTFVTLCAAELLGDKDLLAYSVDRWSRFCAEVDKTGSFAEYNSPTYANVAIANLTRLRMYGKHAETMARVEKVHDRFWQHIALHWHAPSKQLAGPMSRCYSTDIGSPVWLQKSLDNRLAWVSLADLKDKSRGGGEGETATLDWKVPEKFLSYFLSLRNSRQHREVFLPAPEGVRPVQGTTWLTPEYALGSVNRGDFWVQRRPLLAYWGAPPAKFAAVRFLHDDYDFASAQFYCVQEKNWVIGFVNFKSPGGDKHPSLDVVKNGVFPAKRLFLRLDLPKGTKLSSAVDGRVTADLAPDLQLVLQVRGAKFNEYPGRRTTDDAGVSFDLLPPATDTVRWADTREAWIAFTLYLGPKTDASKWAWNNERNEWRTPAGVLALSAGKSVTSASAQDRLFAESIDGNSVPLVRLSDERLA